MSLVNIAKAGIFSADRAVKEYADRIGADAYAKDALETVRYAEQITAQPGG